MFKLAYRYSPVLPPKVHRKVTVNLTVDGVQTEDQKALYILRNAEDKFPLVTLPVPDGKRGEVQVLASAIDGERMVVAYNFTDPRKIAIRNVIINQDLELNIDLNDGTGGGSTEPTEPATAAAVVRVNKQPAARELFAVERRADGTYRFAGSTLISQSGDLEMQVTGGEVYAIAVDDFGIPYQAGLDIEAGQTVRPTNFQGWLYVCTEPGKLPSTEPEWWPEIGDNPARPVGTARLQATRYYQPIAHGPIHYELI